MSRVLRVVTVLVGFLGVAVVVLAGTRTWAHVTVLDMPGMTDVPLGGRDAAPAVVPVALAAGAAVVVLTLSGRLVRALVAIGLILLGALVFTSSLDAADNAGEALARTLRTGVELFGGNGIGMPEGLDTSRTQADVTAWPRVAAGGGVLLALSGLLGLLTGWRWPGPSRRFEAPGEAAAAVPAAGPARADDTWDQLSRGEDPT